MGKSSGGGGTSVSSSTPDYAFNSRMAAVQEQMQGLSNKYFEHWQTTQAPLETAQASAALGLVPLQTQVDKGNLNMELALQPATQTASAASLAAATAKANNITALAPAAQQTGAKFLSAANTGVNANDWATQSGVDAKLSFASKQGELTRNAARLGLNPSSGSYIRAQQDAGTQAALGTAAAVTAGRRAGDEENWKRLSAGASYGAGLFA